MIKEQKITKSLRIVAISDTHSSTSQIQKIINENITGDIFIHCGDFTRYGRETNFDNFFHLMSRLKFKHKIVISGNHEIALDPNIDMNKKNKLLSKYPCKYSREEILQKLKFNNCVYLQHDMVEIQGVRIFGSPYTLKYGNSAFQISKDEQYHIWNELPQVDVLVTHGPPFNILDKTNNEKHAGSQSLLKEVMRIKPKLHIFGHIHQGKGHQKINGIYFFNVARQLQIIDFSL